MTIRVPSPGVDTSSLAGTKPSAAVIEQALLDSDGPPRKATVIELIPDADVASQVGDGDGALDIKVSDTVFGLASKVFWVMLASHFVGAFTRIIELRNDDPQTALNFCYINHHHEYKIETSSAKRSQALMMRAKMGDTRGILKLFITIAIRGHQAWATRVSTNIM
jgi:hypothetical protein